MNNSFLEPGMKYIQGFPEILWFDNLTVHLLIRGQHQVGGQRYQQQDFHIFLKISSMRIGCTSKYDPAACFFWLNQRVPRNPASTPSTPSTSTSAVPHFQERFHLRRKACVTHSQTLHDETRTYDIDPFSSTPMYRLGTYGSPTKPCLRLDWWCPMGSRERERETQLRWFPCVFSCDKFDV